MEMMNRAIEDAADFRDMLEKLQGGQPVPGHARSEAERAAIQKFINDAPRIPTRRPGENRSQYRARVFSSRGI